MFLSTSMNCGESTVGSGIVVGLGRRLVQTRLGAWPGSGIQPRYYAPGDLQLKTCQTSGE